MQLYHQKLVAHYIESQCNTSNTCRTSLFFVVLLQHVTKEDTSSSAYVSSLFICQTFYRVQRNIVLNLKWLSIMGFVKEIRNYKCKQKRLKYSEKLNIYIYILINIYNTLQNEIEMCFLNLFVHINLFTEKGWGWSHNTMLFYATMETCNV